MIGKFVYFSLRPGLLIVDLTTGSKTYMKDWNGLKQPGHVIPSADRVIALTPRGAVAYGLESSVKKVAWAKNEAKEKDAAFLVTCLGSESFPERQRASDLLMKIGKKAKVVIEPLLKHGDLEVSMRAEDLLFEFGREGLKTKWETVMRPEWIAEVPGLFDKLTHRNPKVRLDALDRVGAIDDPDVLVLFKDLLADKNPSIALKSAKILYQKGNRAGIPVFEKLLKTGTEKATIDILGELEKRKARSQRMEDLPLARLAAKSKHVRARVLGAGLLVDLGDRVVINDLKALIADKAPEVRVAAIKGLGDLALDRVGPILTPLVTDKARFVRMAAVKAISGLETKIVADALCLACLDKDVPIARTAAEALLRFAEGENAGKISTDALSKALDVKDAKVREYVVAMLMRGVNRPMKLLVRLAMDKSEAIHRKALDEIYNRAGPGDIQEVSKIAASPNMDVRFSAVQILGELGSPKAGPFLLRMLSDPDQQVREKAAEYLGSQANPHVVLSLLGKRQEVVAEAKRVALETEKARKALAAIGDKDKKDPKYLIAVAETKKYAHQLKEVNAQKEVMVNLIDNMEAETEAPGLILALKSKRLSVRQLAIEELEAIAGVRRNYKAEDPLEQRMKAFANWSRWYFMYKTDKDVEDTFKELQSKKPKERIEAGKALKFLWSKQSQRAIVGALKSEKLPWVAVEFNKILEDIFGIDRALPKNPAGKDITDAINYWQKHLDSLEAKKTETKKPPK
ncbi:MAG: HEAT repeat domain-containing protein [Planctomycetota bacterium]|nr:HEAT repeat domain-containing protein [Planctomycetota bacterium]